MTGFFFSPQHKEFEEIAGHLQRREVLILGSTDAQRLIQQVPVEVISDPLSDVDNDSKEDKLDMHRQLKSHEVLFFICQWLHDALDISWRLSYIICLCMSIELDMG